MTKKTLNSSNGNQIQTFVCKVSKKSARGVPVVYQPIDPNEIVSIDGYDAELAMAATSKVSITMPLHEKSNYATFGVGNASGFRKSFMAASSTCVHDFMLEIPLAHCVRGGMVRFADGRVGKRRAASENVPLPVTSSSPPFFFPFCLLVRNTIPRNVTTLSGISSVWQQTSKKCSLI